MLHLRKAKPDVGSQTAIPRAYPSFALLRLALGAQADLYRGVRISATTMFICGHNFGSHFFICGSHFFKHLPARLALLGRTLSA